MVAIKLARFPRYSRQQITLQNLLTTRRPVFTLEIAQEALNLSLGPLFDSSFDSPFDPSGLPHHIALSVGNASAWLSLSKELLGTLTSPWAIGDEALPPALHEAVLSAALSPLLRVLRTVLGARISVRDDAQPPADGALRLGLWETGQAAGSPCALLYLDATTATQLNASLESMAGVAGWTNWPTLAVEFTLNAGQMPVSAQELATLENNDILLLPAQISASTPMIPWKGTSLLMTAPASGRFAAIMPAAASTPVRMRKMIVTQNAPPIRPPFPRKACGCCRLHEGGLPRQSASASKCAVRNESGQLNTGKV